MIRIYLTHYELRYIEGDSDSAYTWHPFLDAFDELPIDPPNTPMEDRTRMMFKVPDVMDYVATTSNVILVVVSAPVIPVSFASLPGVYMLPPHSLDEKIDDISDREKAEVVAGVAKYGVPHDTIRGATKVADIIDKISRHIGVHTKGTSDRYKGREGKFK